MFHINSACTRGEGSIAIIFPLINEQICFLCCLLNKHICNTVLHVWPLIHCIVGNKLVHLSQVVNLVALNQEDFPLSNEIMNRDRCEGVGLFKG
ncbi:hypothetical protein GDO86_016382 [Hymenochirus boettgeri]|uniref:Uncharacterized protein n=1 Tax=Hymenochirus boettgeri TaxID=247094 RepID=A0A8T2K1U7_9PIPI|nr:hypothetical protein GDO86_016382 [Hymenochirus boettgeri]